MFESLTIAIAVSFIFNTVYSAPKEIITWTTGTAQLPIGWNYQRGFYSEFDEKIYLIGNDNPWVFDPATQTVSEDMSVSGTGATLYADYGAEIGNVYYYVDHIDPTSIQSFDPRNGGTVDSTFAGPSEGVENLSKGCITSNGEDTLYMLYYNPSGVFKKLDVTQPAPHTLQSLTSSPEAYEMAACAYYDGNVYVFFGQGSQKISKYNVVADSWSTVGDIPSNQQGGSKADAVIGNDGYIYIGGSGSGTFNRAIWKFNPTDNSLIRVPDYSDARNFAGVIYSKYDERLYVFSGEPTEAQRSYEYTNVLAPTNYDLSNFQAGAATFVDGNVYHQVGGWNFGDKIYLLGGAGAFNRKVFEFEISSGQLTEIASISDSIQYCGSRASTQINTMIYMIRVVGDPGGGGVSFYLASYDMETNVFNNNINKFSDYSTTHAQSGCMSNINTEYIIITGGGSQTIPLLYNMLIFDLSSESWSEGPQLNDARRSHGCEVVNNRAYVIGGDGAGNSIEYIDVSNMNDINSNSWTLFTDTITSRNVMSTVVYNEFIYVIGGNMDLANGMEVINTLTNRVVDTLSTQVIPTYEGTKYLDGAVVTTLDTIYMFGGYNTNTYQYASFQSSVSKAPYDFRVPASKSPSKTPTEAPSKTPTESPTYKECNPQELDWNSLINRGNSSGLSMPIITSSWNAQTLELNIEITLDYITRSKYTFVDQYDSDRGITYVIDTEPFLSDGRLLSNPNNCENRNAESFIGKDWNTEYWSYLNREDGLNSIDYLEYGPSTDWTLNWDTECETVKYSKSFTFSELLACTDKINENTFVFVDNIVDDIDSLTLEGEFYVTIVSPLINQNNVAYTTDFGQYLTNTIANYPVSISFPKKVASVRDPGVILFDISIFAIQYDETRRKLLVDILSYTAKYINLQNVVVVMPLINYDTNNVVNSITINEDDSYSGSECLFETTFQCFQKFQIEIDLSSCPSTSIDLSTTVILDSEPSCRIGEDCSLFESEFGSPGTKQQLNDNLRYIESCDTEIYIQTFEGTIKYYKDIEFSEEVDETAEFSIGSTLYVDVGVSDIVNYGVFSIDVLNVWICTTSASLEITNQLTGEGGCIENYESNNNQGLNIDEIFQPFKNGVQWDTDLNGQIYETTLDESVRFSLLIPSFQRNKFWLHAIVELKLENNLRRRARLLLTVSHNLGNENNNDGDTNTVNRLSHYIKDVTIVNDVIKTTHGSADTTKQEADSSVSYYSYVMHAICFFTCLFV